jgi:hypothetical protein
MILRRVIEHVRTQNWTAVALDFVIVVTGVFIGIQVANWNEGRAQQRELSASLSNLAQEVSNTAWHRTDQIAWMRRVVAGLELTLEALDGRALSPLEWDSAHFALAQVATPPPDPSRYETLYELRSTGMLRKVPSRELRAALGELLSMDRLVTPFFEMSLRKLTTTDFDPETVTYGLARGEGVRGHAVLRVVAVDIDRARSDPLFRRRVMQGLSAYSMRIFTNESSRRIDCDMLTRLAADGHEPSDHWLVDNLERIIPEAGRKDLPDACENAP